MANNQPKPPSDAEFATRIEKMADYVSRNGVQFEQITRQNQAGNPEFQFLEFGNPANAYYQHVLNCLKHGWTLDQVIEVRVKSNQENMLSAEEDVGMSKVLNDLNGTKETINNGREWILNHTQKLEAILNVIEKRTQQLFENGTLYHTHILYLVYLMNDILLRSSSSEVKTKIGLKLINMMKCAKLSCPSENDKVKVLKVATMWKDKSIFPSSELAEQIVSMAKYEEGTASSQQVYPPQQQQPTPQQQYQPHPQQPQSFQPPQQPQSFQPPQQAQSFQPGPPGHMMMGRGMPPPGFHQQQNFGMPPRGPPLPGAMNGLPPPPGFIPPSQPFGRGIPQPTMPIPQPVNKIDAQVSAALQVSTTPSAPMATTPSTDGGSLSSQIRMQMSQINMQPGGVASVLATPQSPAGVLPSTNTPTAPVIQPPKKLEEMPVGAMAGIIKIALANGHKKYAPFDPSRLLGFTPPPVEPGRLDARVTDYYRRMEADSKKTSSSSRSSSSSSRPSRDTRSRSRSPSGSSRYRGGGNFDVVGERRERRNSFDRQTDHPTTSSSKDKAINEDNVGYEMLKGMGWEEGSGLGASNEGIAKPINDGGQVDKVGVGSRNPNDNLDDYFAAYRNERSGTYHRRGPSSSKLRLEVDSKR